MAFLAARVNAENLWSVLVLTQSTTYRDTMRAGGATANRALEAALAEVGWSSYELARRINRVLGDGYVHRTTPRAWCTGSVTPRTPLPRTVARLLSEAAGRLIRPTDLWPGLGDDGLLATHEGLTQAWSAGDLPRLVVEVGSDGRDLVCLSGADLLRFTNAWRPRDPRPLVGRAPADPVLAHLDAELARLRTIDDGFGGQALLTVVVHQQRLLATLAVQYGEHTWQSRACLGLLAEYTQFAGWLALDLGQHARAQRSFFLAIRLCDLAADLGLAGLVVSCLAIQAVIRGRPQDARRLSESATADEGVESSIAWMRRARSSAALGDEADFRQSMERARQLWSQDGASQPAWAYWLTEDLLLAEEGRGWIDLGDLRRARPSLTCIVAAPGTNGRDRVLYGASLAEAHLGDGAVDQACAEVEDTLPYLAGTSSRRCRDLLTNVTRDLSVTPLPARHRQVVDAARTALATEPAIQSA